MPKFLISENGLRVGDMFRNPKRVKRYLANQLGLSEDISNSIITADVGFEGVSNLNEINKYNKN